ncbi:MAG: phasin family protein [Pseudomonas sp.]
MAGKKTLEKEGSSLVGEVEKYSRQIWLAGLGAYSKISKDGTKLFDNLVEDGEKAETLVMNEVDKQVDVVKSSAQSAKSRVEGVKDRALGKWNELEEAFDKRLNGAISRLGVPSRNEVKELHAKVEVLTEQVEKLTGISASSVKATVKPAKPAAKTAKPAAKAVASTAKSAATSAKSTVKSAAKTVAKTADKAVEKTAEKVAEKTADKPAVTAAAKPAETATNYKSESVQAKPVTSTTQAASAPTAASTLTPRQS